VGRETGGTEERRGKMGGVGDREKGGRKKKRGRRKGKRGVEGVFALTI